MVSLLPPQLPCGRSDHSLKIPLSLEQDTAVLETLPAHISQLGHSPSPALSFACTSEHGRGNPHGLSKNLAE